MQSKMLNKFLIDNFPELIDAYDSEVSWQEGNDTGSHIVYGDVFMPYVENAIEKNLEDELKRIFSFIETVLLTEDTYSQEVIMFSVLERILFDKKNFAIAKKYFGETTKQLVEELQQNEG